MKKIAVLVTFFIIMAVTSGCYSENYDSKTTSQDAEYSMEDLRQKVDKAITIMEIIRDDIDELDNEMEAAEKTAVKSPEDMTKGEALKNNIDTMIKVMEVIKDDVDEIEKLDDRKRDKRIEEEESGG